ncbi:MAG: hypothetical protein GEV11_24875, partial [Streptosporangiales bacterium]|nr:hypothetical protein [Streptosporangiales bacterium]
EDAEDAEDAEGTAEPPDPGRLARPLGLWAVIFTTSLVVGIVGFPIAMIALVAVVLIVIERRRGIGAIVTIIAIPLSAWLLFAYLLQVPLPAGPFGL